MKYINLSETLVSNTIFANIATKWQYSMINMSLPERFSRELKLFSNCGHCEQREKFKKVVLAMPKLKYLHMGHYRFHITDVMRRRMTVQMLSRMFPNIHINFNPFGTLGPPASDPNSKFKNVITPEAWQMRD